MLLIIIQPLKYSFSVCKFVFRYACLGYQMKTHGFAIYTVHDPTMFEQTSSFEIVHFFYKHILYEHIMLRFSKKIKPIAKHIPRLNFAQILEKLRKFCSHKTKNFSWLPFQRPLYRMKNSFRAMLLFYFSNNQNINCTPGFAISAAILKRPPKLRFGWEM